jgi:hypothetical protein
MAGGNNRRFAGTPVVFIACLAACVLTRAAIGQSPGVALKVGSSSFREGQPIPIEYTCAGADISPPLHWSAGPAGTKTFALICDDPDAPSGTWCHWVLYNLPTATTDLPEKTPTTATLAGDARQGTNDFKRTGYSGPCPPPGKPHRYFFKIYALDTTLALKPGATRQELLRAIAGHVIAKGDTVGIFQRKN